MKFDAELGQPSTFKGPPRQELDDAWGALVDRMSSSDEPEHDSLTNYLNRTHDSRE